MGLWRSQEQIATLNSKTIRAKNNYKKKPPFLAAATALALSAVRYGEKIKISINK